MFFSEAIEHATHQVKGAEGMCKTRMLRTLVSVETKSELLDATQPLKFRRVNQTHHQLAFVGVGAKTNDVVDRIAIDSFGHLGFLNNRKRTERQSHLDENQRWTRSHKSQIRASDFWTFPIFWICRAGFSARRPY